MKNTNHITMQIGKRAAAMVAGIQKAGLTKMRFRLACAMVGCLACSALPVKGAVTFDNRENVDLLNSDAVTITSAAPGNAQRLVGFIDDPAFWEGGNNNLANDVLTINLGETRNLKTIKLGNAYGDYMISSATIETATSLGGPWTVAPATISNPDASHFTAVLNNAINAPFLRITPTAYSGATPRFVLNDLRVFGDSGATLSSGTHLDLISSNAFSTAGAVVITSTGGSFVGDLATDNPSPNIARKVVYDLQSGDSVKIAFDRSILFGRFGFEPSAFTDPSATFRFQVWGSTNGTSFTSLLLDQTGPEPGLPTFYNLAPFTGTALRFDIVNTTAGELRFGDFFVFATEAPEPSTVMLLGLGGLLVWRKAGRGKR